MVGHGIAVFFTETVVIEPWLGTDSAGIDVFGAPASFNGFLDGKRSLVRGADGEQIISNSSVYTYLDAQASAVPNSRVTVNGVQSRVITANPNSGGAALRLPNHLVITLQ